MSTRISRLAFAAALALPCAIVPGRAAPAATLTVSDLGDSGAPGQLRTLMNAAAPGDTILVPAGTITLAGPAGEDLNAGGDLDVLKDLTIRGAGAGTTRIDGALGDRVLDVHASSVATIESLTIQNGLSSQGGGGGVRNAGTLTLAHVVETSSQAPRGLNGDPNAGGGIRNVGTLTAHDLVVQLNTCRDEGGGIQNEPGAVMTLVDSTVRSNFANKDGGGIRNLGRLALSGVTLSANNTDHGGGGIATSGAAPAEATLIDVTVYLNNASTLGGGVYNTATASLFGVTVSANTTPSAGGGAGLANTGAVTARNVLFGANAAAGVEGTCSGAITSLGNNLDSGTTCLLAGAGDLTSSNPRLGPFQNNGGLTDTLALLPGSPAIDAGATAGCPATDQRGVTRPQGASCDIGAYEAQSIALEVAPAVLPGATVGATYAQALSVAVVSGGPYTPPAPSFAVTAGALPAGLTLGAAGALGGKPTTAGPASFTVTATDGNGLTASRAYALTVASPTTSPVLDVAPAVLPGATVGTAYAETLSVIVANGVTYTPPAPGFAVTAGALPAGLTLLASGALGGTPTAAGASAFTVTATDGNGLTASRAYALDVAPPPRSPVLDVAPAVLPDAIAGAAYAHALGVVVINGVAYAPPAPGFAVTAGALPAGLTLGASGVVEGMPTTAGSSTFTVTATDGNGLTASRAYTLAVAASPQAGSSGSGCGCGSGPGASLGVLLALLVAAHPRRRPAGRGSHP